MVRLVSCSIWTKLAIAWRKSASYCTNFSDQDFPAAKAFTSQTSWVSCPIKLFWKVAFGILALSTTILWIVRSWLRTCFMMSRIRNTKASNCFGTKRNVVKISDNTWISALVLAEVRPCFAMLASVFWCWSLSTVNFSRATSGSMLLSLSLSSLLFSSLPSSSSNSSVASTLSRSSSDAKVSSNSALSASVMTFGSTKPVIKSAKRASPLSTASYWSMRLVMASG